MNSKKNRASLMVVVAAYLIYTVWQLFQGRNDPETTMSPALIYLFCALFAVAGVGVVIYAVRLWREGREEDKKPPEDNNEDKLLK